MGSEKMSETAQEPRLIYWRITPLDGWFYYVGVWEGYGIDHGVSDKAKSEDEAIAGLHAAYEKFRARRDSCVVRQPVAKAA